MKPRHRRLAFLVAGLSALAVAAALVSTAFRNNLVFFHTPSEVAAGAAPAHGVFRIGGMVEKGSVQPGVAPLAVHFRVTDFRHTLDVDYQGTLPDLFREGQGVVAEGRLGADGRFAASKVLAKHDEKYMPPEVAAALQAGGTPPVATP